MIRTGEDLVTIVLSGVSDAPAKAKRIFETAKPRAHDGHRKGIVPGHKSRLLGAVCAFAVLSDGQVVLGQAGAPVVPLVPGLTIVLAAHNPAHPGRHHLSTPSGTSRRGLQAGHWR